VAVLEKGRPVERQPVIIIVPVALVIRVGFVQPLVNVHDVRVFLTLQQVIIVAGNERPHHVAHGEELKPNKLGNTCKTNDTAWGGMMVVMSQKG
jgi:hypothetical protein